MNPDIFAEWLRRQGHRVIRTASSYWYNAAPRVFQAFPYHWVIQPSSGELQQLMLKQKIVALRYSCPIKARSGMASYHVILTNPDIFRALNEATRRNIRRGLLHCQVERISLDKLAEEGWTLQQETLERQGRTGSMNQKKWQRLCLAAEGLPGFEGWGAIQDGKLVSTLLCSIIEDTVIILHQQSKTSQLNFRVNNALIHVFTQAMLQRPGTRSIFYSLHSLDASPGVDEFKFRMGYSAKPLRQVVVFNPHLQPFINDMSHGFIKALLNIFPSNSAISKAEGIFRFYLQGKRPLSEQDWPKVLLGQKDAILASEAQSEAGTGNNGFLQKS
jgi:hypothetical protein